jgi:hypothetical protein
MKREQLTNVTTEAQFGTYCSFLARTALQNARLAVYWRDAAGPELQYNVAEYECNVIELADRIIALRSQQVTP